jgi:predicted nucleic acid-binding protein
MNKCICLDSSVIIKILTWEEKSDKAVALFNRVLENNYNVLLPDFAWAEIGSVLRKKVRSGILKENEAFTLWEAFANINNIQFIHYNEIWEKTWDISNREDLPTLYDAAFLAVCEVYKINEFWTADLKLLNSLSNNWDFVKEL